METLLLSIIYIYNIYTYYTDKPLFTGSLPVST